MNKNRMWTIGAVLLMVVVAAMGWFLGISPKLAEADTANSEAATVESLNLVHEAELAVLKKQYEGIDAIKAELAELRLSLPPTESVASFIRQLNSLAQTTGVTIDGITTGANVAFAPEAEPVDSTVAAPTDEQPAEAAETPAPPVAGPLTSENFVLIPISVKLTGSYASVLAFTQGLQNGQRLFLASGVTAALVPPTAPVKGKPQVGAVFDGQVDGFIYVLVDPTIPAPIDAESTAATPAPEAAAAE